MTESRNPDLSDLPPALAGCVERVRRTVMAAAERSEISLGLSVNAGMSARLRDNLALAQFELTRRIAPFEANFMRAWTQRLAQPFRASVRARQGATTSRTVDWGTLALMDDGELDARVSAERIALELSAGSDWELRELGTYTRALVHTWGGTAAGGSGRGPDSNAPGDSNLLGPEHLAGALCEAIASIAEGADIRKILQLEFTRSLQSQMQGLYRALAEDLRIAGVVPMEFAPTMPPSGFGHSTGMGGGAAPPRLRGDGSHIREADAAAGAQEAWPSGSAGGGGLPVEPHGGGARPARHGTTAPATGSAGPVLARRASRGSAPMGQVDRELMVLLRDLAARELPSEGAGAVGDASWQESAVDPGSGLRRRLAAPNVIRQHQGALKAAAPRQFDAVIIDVIGSLFDQVLSDPKVPPQMARQIARLQLPVLRAALGDPSFFSSRRHPVRRFINRLAALAVAFDTLDNEAGQAFLARVRDLVHAIVEGDFDHAQVYEQPLAELERLAAQAARRAAGSQGEQAAQLLAARENELRAQRGYVRQLDGSLQPLAAPQFVREFITKVWSHVIVKVTAQAREPGAAPEVQSRQQRMIQAGRDLFMSVQPKGTQAQRAEFLARLPGLMGALNEGMELIGWPPTAKEAFFALLLPAHARSLKADGGLATLEFNLLSREVETAFQAAVPSAENAGFGDTQAPVATDAQADAAPVFTPEEAARVGLIAEQQVDWSTPVAEPADEERPQPAAPGMDADAALARSDLSSVMGLQPAGPPESPEPTHGAALADTVQPGYGYRLHIEGQWVKARLAHVSPGRSFFLFTSTERHQRTVSLTYRMLQRMCEQGRLRAVEQAWLLERASERTRAQLAAMRRAR